MKKKLKLYLFISFGSINFIYAQECCKDATTTTPNTILVSTGSSYASADMRINTNPANTSVDTSSSNLILKVTIENIMNDDCAHDTKAIVILPPNTEILSYKAITQNNDTLPMKQCYGFLLVDAGMVCPKPDGTKKTPKEFKKFTITVKTGRRPLPEKSSFGVVVYSSTPDPVPQNNYWSWRER